MFESVQCAKASDLSSPAPVFLSPQRLVGRGGSVGAGGGNDTSRPLTQVRALARRSSVSRTEVVWLSMPLCFGSGPFHTGCCHALRSRTHYTQTAYSKGRNADTSCENQTKAVISHFRGASAGPADSLELRHDFFNPVGMRDRDREETETDREEKMQGEDNKAAREGSGNDSKKKTKRQRRIICFLAVVCLIFNPCESTSSVASLRLSLFAGRASPRSRNPGC